jgi:hypothetical protein
VPAAHRMATSHLPTTAKVGLRTHGFTADKGHAESAKQIAPSLFDRDTAAGMMMSSTTSAPRMAATTVLGFFRVWTRAATPRGRCPQGGA